VALDEMCRKQQVNDGCFPVLADVPTHAITITCPGLMMAQHVFCIVPGPTKANAVYHTLEEEITTRYPSTVLRLKKGAVMYLDAESASQITEQSQRLTVRGLP
jgi:glucosamine-6-phosphate deaminase